MNFRQLEVFRAMMDAGTTVGAARALELSQPAVSQHLAQLEDELGLSLFARERGRLVPTLQALALYDEVAYAFEGVERVMNLAQSFRSHTYGLLRIATPHSFCETLLPRVLARLSAERPHLRYTVEIGTYEAIIGMVAGRHVDLGIVKEPLRHPGVSSCPFLECEAVCAMSPQHPLAAKARLEVPDLSGEPLIMLGRRKAWRHEIDAIFRRSNLIPNIRIETQAAGVACGFVAAGLGIAVIPEFLGAQYVERGIVLRSFTPSITHRFVIAYPSALNNQEFAVHFAKLARADADIILAEARPAAPESRLPARAQAETQGGHG